MAPLTGRRREVVHAVAYELSLADALEEAGPGVARVVAEAYGFASGMLRLPGGPPHAVPDAVRLPLNAGADEVAVLELSGPVSRHAERSVREDHLAIQEVIATFVERRRAQIEADAARREVLTLVSHELRTPLTSILGYVQMLEARMAGAGEAERRSVEIIGRNAGRLHRLVGDLLFAAEVSAGGVRVEPGQVCLRALVHDAADAARPAADARGVDVVIDEEPVDGVAGDEGRLAQVLDNLLANAVKFSHAGGQVVVRVRQAGAGVEVAVIDQGIGVPAAERAQLGQQFVRASTARDVPGLGLGLALSRTIVEAHGGLLWLASVEGRGTTVTITLPAVAVSAHLAA